MKKLLQQSDSFKSQMDFSPGLLIVNKKTETEAEVFVYGDIGGWSDCVSAEAFAKDLAGIEAETINVRLNSGGGSVFEGIAIYNALAKHNAKVVVHIEGIAASIASVIAMAGDHIVIHEGSRMMIHKPWSFAGGDAMAMRKQADILDALESDIVDIYQARTENGRGELAQWMADETWLSARDAVDKGFSDEMCPAKVKPKNAATAMMSLYRHTPQDVLDDPAPTVREMEDIIRNNGGFSKSISKILAKEMVPQRDVAGQTQRDAGEVIDVLLTLANTFK